MFLSETSTCEVVSDWRTVPIGCGVDRCTCGGVRSAKRSGHVRNRLKRSIREHHGASTSIKKHQHRKTMSDSESDDNGYQTTEEDRINEHSDIATGIITSEKFSRLEKLVATHLVMNGRGFRLPKTKEWDFYEDIAEAFFSPDNVMEMLEERDTVLRLINRPFRRGRYDNKIIVVLEGEKVTMEGIGEPRVHYIGKGTVIWFQSPMFARFEGDFKIVVFEDV